MKERLDLIPDTEYRFPINVDGATMLCQSGARFQIVDSVRLFSSRRTSGEKERETE